MSEIRYFMPMFDRLTPRTPWTGGRIVDTDPLTLADAASMATKHAGEPVTIGDFLRAAARGEITLRAIVHRTTKVQKHDGGIYCNGGQENENKVPAGAIATLPLTACQHLAGTGLASWRTFDGFEMVEGVLQRYTKGRVLPDEPDFETVLNDCRVVGYDVHALADEYVTEPAPAQNTAPPAPVVAVGASGGVMPAAAPTWSLKTSIQRAPGYRWPLYQTLKSAYIAGLPCPKARDVLDTWALTPPPDLQVMPDGVKYNDHLGNQKEANLKAIGQAIKYLLNKSAG